MARAANIPDRFRGKTWISTVQVAFALLFGLFALLMGISFSSGKAQNAQGQPVAKEVGYGLLAFGAGALLYTYLANVNRKARKQPVVRIYGEGVEFDRYSCDIIDEQEQPPGSLGLIGASLSGRAGPARYYRARWDELAGVGIGGGLGKRGLVAEGSLAPAVLGGPAPARQVVLLESYFRGRLEPVVEAIQYYAENTEARRSLPSWDANAKVTA